MSFKSDLKQLLKPYYIVNILLSLSYIISKRTPGLCNYLFKVDDCEFDGRETEILFFLVIVVMIRTRKSGSVTMVNYLSSSFIYTKIANLILWFNADIILGIVYAVVFILSALIFPEPTYSGPDNIIYFRGLQNLEEEFNKQQKDPSYWFVTFYTVWNPVCVNFAPVFAQLSNEYHIDNLSFGKVDVGRYPEASKKYRINDGSLSKQLPTVIMFKDGKEICRHPFVDAKNTVSKFHFSLENVKRAFDLNNIYQECKKTKKTSQNNVKQIHQKKD